MLAVLLEESNSRYAYGPFDEDEREIAERFAEFLTVEVDPARVVPLSEIDPGIVGRSALVELLNWREAVLRWRADR